MIQLINLQQHQNNKMTQMIQLPLKQLFGDVNYAWELLEWQIKLEVSDSVGGQDISNLLQLYMRGVEKMNSLMDIRQSFFKNRVTTLMTRPTVMKNLNKPKPMSKKTQAPVIESSPVKKVEVRNELQLQEKKKEIQMRLAYGVEEHNPDALKKMINDHSQKEQVLSKKIVTIVNSHEERLMKRIKQRKLRTMTLKSKSDVFVNSDMNGLEFMNKKEIMEKNRDEQQFGNSSINEIKVVKKQKIGSRAFKSLETKRGVYSWQKESPTKRRVSVDYTDPDKKRKL